MDKEQERILNKKLARWRWSDGKCLGYFPRDGDLLWGTKEEQHWVNFPNDLTACLEWLVPKLRHYEINNWSDKDKHWAYTGIEKGNYKVARAETPALALCLAIEKLIDEETDG